MSVSASVFREFRPSLAQAPLGFALSPAELASLLASRICHDLISPVGAVNNAMELYEDGLSDDDDALQLAAGAAANASARLQFARLAYGAAGSAGDSVSAASAEKLAQDCLGSDRLSLSWQAQMPHLPKEAAKFLLNLVILAAASVPRGGQIDVLLAETAEAHPRFCLRAQGALCRLPPAFAALYSGAMPKSEVSAHNIQFYWILVLSAAAGMPLQIAQKEDGLYFIA